METIHLVFRITRERDQEYIPSGRLRHYDLMIFDEVSQIDAFVWHNRLRVALGELSPCPFVVFVADFQQLQPVANSCKKKQHESARSTDPDVLDFLHHCRVKQPSRELLTRFSADRILSKDLCKGTTAAKTFEAQHEGMRFTFLTVTNRGAANLNASMLQLDYPDATNQILRGEGLPPDPSAAAGPVVFQHGMRVHMTQNVDKDRGFVNGNGGVVEHVLRKDVLVVKTFQVVRMLVHPITVNKVKFMPVTYAHATTIRRAQGATLDAVGLYFDKTRPDRGCGYVSASRAKRHTAVYLVGKVRRTEGFLWVATRRVASRST